MQDRYLRRAQVTEMTGLARSTIYAKMAKSDFPLPRKIGSRSVAWNENAIKEWLDSCEYAKYANA
ncbi:MAG: DNA-binding protein [Paracoccus denitrificans]|nr:MAG: DNA-binding protein [Paracoccus denitrificans]PZO84797.1 MAG: DNA-binding protein [Paracoccus denitrificans]